MCGINGIAFYAAAPALASLVSMTTRMSDVLAHRGPDGGGTWTSSCGRIALGHRRLTVIDKSSRGSQPMTSDDGRYALSFNGEIYNFPELRLELEALGVVFKSSSDTEVLLHLLIHYGTRVFDKLDGMYAFCFVDQVGNELLLARDPFGEKPLYYSCFAGGFAFASELQALQTLPMFDDSINADAVSEYFLLQYIMPPRTIFNGAQALPPGCCLTVRGGTMCLKRHFLYEPGTGSDYSRSIDDSADELEDILTRSIRRRLVSDVPLGAFLSGGIDSSLICALVSRKLSRNIRTFSIGFGDSDQSEHVVSRESAELLGTNHQDRVLRAHEVDSYLSRVVCALDQPNADTSCFPTFVLSELARKYVTVALSGDGGDELFAGYNRNRATLEDEAAFTKSMSSCSDFMASRAYLPDRFFLFDVPHLSRLLTRPLQHVAQLVESMETDLDNRSYGPLVSRLRRFDMQTFLPGAVLAKTDRMAMHHALEVRSPFLSVELARFSEKVPPSFCYAAGQGKYILRHLTERYFPSGLARRPKQGFGLPARSPLTSPLLRVFTDLAERPDLLCYEWLSRAYIRQMAQWLQSNSATVNIDRLWSIVVLESWLRKRGETPCDAQQHRAFP